MRTWQESHQFPDATDKVGSKTFEMDGKLSSISQSLAVRYISPVRLLCNKSQECQTMVVAGKPETVFAFDQAHLTDAGSKYLVGKMKGEIVSDAAP